MRRTLDTELLKTLVESTGASIDELSEKIGICASTMMAILHGKNMPSVENIIKLADYFVIPVDVLLGRWTEEEVNSLKNNYPKGFMKLRTRSYEDYIYKVYGSNIGRVVQIDFTKMEHEVPWPYNLLSVLIKEEWTTPLSDDQKDGLTYALNELSDRELDVINRYYRDNNTLEKVGSQIGVTKERVRQIAVKAVRKLRNPVRFGYIRFGLAGNKSRDDLVYLNEQIRIKSMELEKLNAQLDEQETHVQETIRDVPLDILPELELSVRSFNCLRRAGVRTLEDLTNIIEDKRIFKIRNLGRKSIMEIFEKLKNKYGLNYDYYTVLNA